MTLSLDPPPCPDSLLRHLDPRWKLAALLLASAGVAALRTWPAALAAVAATLLLAAIARLPLRWYVARAGGSALFLALFAAPLPFLLGGDGPAVDLGPLRLSAYGLAAAVVLVAKGVALVTLLLVLVAAAPLDATLKAAHALRVPGLLVQLTVLTYRYIHVVAEELARLRVALRSRGFRSAATGHTYRTVGNVTGALLLRSCERAERVGQAMRCRGFDGRFRSLAEFRTTAADVLAFALLVGGAAALVTWELLGG